MKYDTYLQKLAYFYSNLKFQDVSEEVRHKTKLAIFDFLVVLIAGKFFGPLSLAIEKYTFNRKEQEEATILTMKQKCSAQTAALIMGMISHSVELDDGHRYGTAHPAVAVIPAAIAVGDKKNCCLDTVIKAVAVGYDCMLRFARSINPYHLMRGFHTTGTCGAIGAAAAVSIINNYDEAKTAHTISISALQSAGIQEMLHSNPAIKVLQPGKAAQAGVFASELADLNITGPISVFEGIHGWLKAMTDDYDESALLDKLGSHWEITKTYTKLYPTCRHCHAAIDLAIEFFKEGYRLIDVDLLTIYTYNIAISEVGIIKTPVSFDESMFSVTYSAAIALKYGAVRIQELNSSLNDLEILNFASKIKIVQDKDMDEKYPEQRGARLVLTLKNGNHVSKQSILPKGEFDTPLTDREYIEKAKTILQDIVSNDWIEALWDTIMVKPSSEIYIKNIIDMFKEINV